MTIFSSDLVEELPVLRRVAMSCTQDRDQADDLVQTCAMRALANQHRFQPGTNLRAWLCRILRNEHLDRRRQQSRRIQVPVEDHHMVTLGAQESVARLTETADAMARMPTGFRDVVNLVGVEGYSYEEAADALDLPIGTVRSRLSRARRFLTEDEPTAGSA